MSSLSDALNDFQAELSVAENVLMVSLDNNYIDPVVGRGAGEGARILIGRLVDRMSELINFAQELERCEPTVAAREAIESKMVANKTVRRKKAVAR